MRLTQAFAKQSRVLIFVEMLAALVTIGLFDVVSGYQIRLLPFYAGPVFVVAWFCDKKSAIAAGLCAGAISLTADWLDHDPDLQGWAQGWEVFRHLVSCIAVALVGMALRAKRDIANARIALLEHNQRLEEEIVQTTDAEQRRIGQDLHDGLCQYLAALTCSATELSDDLNQLRLRPQAESAAELAELLRDAVVQTRDLAYRLVPAHISRVGLVVALESLAHSVSRLHGISCTFEARGPAPAYDENYATDLYRIAQEAINNATRHGQAHRIAVSLETTNGTTVLNVLDDGLGFSSKNVGGTGLQIMTYRARLNGGEIKVEQPPTGGTLVSCTTKTAHEVTESAA